MWSLQLLKNLTFIFVVILISACSSDESKIERYYQNALNYIQNDDNPSAIIELLNVISLDAKHANARYQLGLLYLEESEPQKAFHELTRAASLAPDNLDANLKTAEFFFLTKNKDECRHLVEKILTRDPTYHDAIALKANLELSEGNFDEALIVLDTAGDAVNESDTLLMIQGRIFAAKGDYEAAENSFRIAITIDGIDLGKHMALLQLYRQQRNVAEVNNLLDEIVEMFPDNPQSFLLRASAYHSEGNYDLAEKELLKVIDLNQEKGAYRLMLADFYRSIGKSLKYEQTLVKAHKDLEGEPQITSTLATYYLATKKYEQAKTLITQLQSNYPDHGETKLLEARVLLKDGKITDALMILQSLSADFPKWSEPHYFQGLAQFSLGNIDLAQHSVSSAIDTNLTNARYHALMSKLLQTKGAYNEARDEAAIALRLDPRNLTSAILLGKSLIGMKSYEKAVELFTEINQRFPGNVEVLGGLTTSYLRLGRLDEAETIIEELLTHDPANSQAILWLIALKYNNNLPEAERFLRAKITEIPDDYRLYLLLGNLLERQDKTQKALDVYNQAQKLNSADAQAYLDSARLLVLLGKKEEARAVYEKTIQQNPNNIKGYKSLAALHHAAGEDSEAISYYRKILDIKEDDAAAANNLAWLLAESQEADLAEALRLAMIAKNQLSSDPRIADTLGWVYYKRGSFDLAIAQFEFALQQDQNIPAISYHLALAYNANGQAGDAIRILESLVDNNSEFDKREEAKELLKTLNQ